MSNEETPVSKYPTASRITMSRGTKLLIDTVKLTIKFKTTLLYNLIQSQNLVSHIKTSDVTLSSGCWSKPLQHA